MVDTSRALPGHAATPDHAHDPPRPTDPSHDQRAEDTINDDAGSSLRGVSCSLTETYDVALVDLDGVVYLDGEAIPGAPEAVAGARERGMWCAFVTNNASRTPHRVADQLRGLGIAARGEDIVTSAQAAARLVAERVPEGSRVLVVGAVALRRAVREQGLRPVSTAREDPAAVVQGYTPRISYTTLAEGALAVRRGAVFVGTNADPTLPTPRGPLPGNGALLRVIATATGQEPLTAGKPELPLHREALVRTRARVPLVVGDRLDTDVEGAIRAETPSLLVLSGVTDPAQVVAAPPHRRPTYVARDLGGLLETHPATYRDGDVWRCRGWGARDVGGALQLDGDGDAYDGLRALCAAAWASDRGAGDPLDPDSLTRALRLLGFGE